MNEELPWLHHADRPPQEWLHHVATELLKTKVTAKWLAAEWPLALCCARIAASM